MMTQLLLTMAALSMEGQVYAPRPPQAPTPTRDEVSRPPQAPTRSVLESDSVPAPKSSPTIFRWVEMETPAGAYGLYQDGRLIGLHRSDRGYQRKQGETDQGIPTFEAESSRPPIDLPSVVLGQRKEGRIVSGPFSSSGNSEAGQAIADAEEQESRLLSMLPDGFQFYKPAEYSQRLSILNERDHNEMVHWRTDDTLFNRVNPNKVDPYAVPGGLTINQHNRGLFRSRTAIWFPGKAALEFFSRRVEANAQRLLPKWTWRFPPGTIVADVLMNAKGEPFEIRMLEGGKREGEWSPKLYYSDMAKAPPGYKSVRMNECMSCHRDAGKHGVYGTGVRGSDGVFSFTPFVDGTFNVDARWPVERK